MIICFFVIILVERLLPIVKMSIYYRLKVLFYVDMQNFLEIKSRKQEVFVTCAIVVKTYEVEQQI